MLAVMRQHVRLQRTVADPNTYVVAADASAIAPELRLAQEDVAIGGPEAGADTARPPAGWRYVAFMRIIGALVQCCRTVLWACASICTVAYARTLHL